MVTAGVYMVARSSAIYAHAPKALVVVAVIGALTAIFAASIGLVQNDIKRVLAYSTVSQLGYMFLGCGVGAFAAGVFHLMTHAFFKALLFLGSGSVIHGMSGEQDMRKMGGLKAKMPKTHLTMLVGCIAIAGIPPLAGFFSKDEILWSAFKIGTTYGRFVWAVGLVAAAMTAFYMFRLYHMTFSGTLPRRPRRRASRPRVACDHDRAPAGPGRGLDPRRARRHSRPDRQPHRRAQLVRAFLHPVFADAHHALEKVFTAEEPGHGLEAGLMLASVVVAAVGNHSWPRASTRPTPRSRSGWPLSFATAHRVLTNKYYVDELYGKVFVRGLVIGGGNAFFANDRYFVDGGDGEVRPGFGVNGLAWLTRDIVARLSNFWDKWIVDGSVNLFAAILDNLSYVFRAVQNGQVQNYALSALIGLFLLIGLVGRYMLGLY